MAQVLCHKALAPRELRRLESMRLALATKTSPGVIGSNGDSLVPE